MRTGGRRCIREPAWYLQPSGGRSGRGVGGRPLSLGGTVMGSVSARGKVEGLRSVSSSALSDSMVGGCGALEFGFEGWGRDLQGHHGGRYMACSMNWHRDDDPVANGSTRGRSCNGRGRRLGLDGHDVRTS